MQSINPSYWGNCGWKFMHYITLSYPKSPTIKDKTDITNFFNNVGNVLPCALCRINYYNHLKKYPLDDKVIENRENLVKWLVNIHNEVNMMHDKTIYTVDKLYKEYMTENTNCYKYIIFVIFVVLILIILWRKL
jgi:hypothetical protein